jgi:hypothetical protein
VIGFETKVLKNCVAMPKGRACNIQIEHSNPAAKS